MNRATVAVLAILISVAIGAVAIVMNSSAPSPTSCRARVDGVCTAYALPVPAGATFVLQNVSISQLSFSLVAENRSSAGVLLGEWRSTEFVCVYVGSLIGSASPSYPCPGGNETGVSGNFSVHLSPSVTEYGTDVLFVQPWGAQLAAEITVTRTIDIVYGP